MKYFIIIICSLYGQFCLAQTKPNVKSKTMNEKLVVETATFGTGCFWCTEAVFQQLEGVVKVTSGYSGGTMESPTYKQVCTGTTGHAECLQIIYNPSKISYDELLEVFWQVHDPTTLNRQGNDIGTQYRSVVFYHDAIQKAKVEKYATALNKINYSGVISVESFTPMNQQLAEAVCIWKPLADSQEVFAQAGLNFMKKIFK